MPRQPHIGIGRTRDLETPDATRLSAVTTSIPEPHQNSHFVFPPPSDMSALRESHKRTASTINAGGVTRGGRNNCCSLREPAGYTDNLARLSQNESGEHHHFHLCTPSEILANRSPHSLCDQDSTQTLQRVLLSASSQWPTTQIGKGPNGEPVFIDFVEKANEHPPIPAPVPAPHSGEDGGRGTLDKILDNREGTTNVYVRGLQPNTTDEMLYAYGRRFGPIVSQKAIIDHSTNACKG